MAVLNLEAICSCSTNRCCEGVVADRDILFAFNFGDGGTAWLAETGGYAYQAAVIGHIKEAIGTTAAVAACSGDGGIRDGNCNRSPGWDFDIKSTTTNDRLSVLNVSDAINTGIVTA